MVKFFVVVRNECNRHNGLKVPKNDDLKSWISISIYIVLAALYWTKWESRATRTFSYQTLCMSQWMWPVLYSYWYAKCSAIASTKTRQLIINTMYTHGIRYVEETDCLCVVCFLCFIKIPSIMCITYAKLSFFHWSLGRFCFSDTADSDSRLMESILFVCVCVDRSHWLLLRRVSVS